MTTFAPAILFRTVIRIDEDLGGPPWTLEAWNPDSEAWETIGNTGVMGIDHLIIDCDGSILMDTSTCSPILE